MEKEDPPKSLEEYLQHKFKEFWITAAWLEGLLCLRCHPEGVWAAWKNAPNSSWCMICGKDPLMHGPTREDIPKIKTEFMNGSRAHRMWLDEILGTDI